MFHGIKKKFRTERHICEKPTLWQQLQQKTKWLGQLNTEGNLGMQNIVCRIIFTDMSYM